MNIFQILILNSTFHQNGYSVVQYLDESASDIKTGRIVPGFNQKYLDTTLSQCTDHWCVLIKDLERT